MTQRDLLNARFGNPVLNQAKFEAQNMMLWDCQKEFPVLPFRRMYINRYILIPLQETFRLLQDAGLLTEIKTFDGCFNIRHIRGSTSVLSIHSWGLAVDFNASDNPLGLTREECIANGLTPFSEAFFSVWRQTGWVCGIDFSRSDGMHMQYSKDFESRN